MSAGVGGAGGAGGAGMAGYTTCGVVAKVPAAATAKVTLTFTDFLSMSGVAGLTVKVCGGQDVACANPLDTQTTDATGKATLTVPTPAPAGFTGYFEATGGSIATLLAYMSNPITANTSSFYLTLSSALLPQLAGAAGTQLDPTRGSAVTLIRDCANSPAAGLTWAASAADAKTTIGYTANNLPSPSATATDATGTAYALNIPVGTTTLSTFDEGNKIKLGEVDALIRAGAVTEIYFEPTP